MTQNSPGASSSETESSTVRLADHTHHITSRRYAWVITISRDDLNAAITLFPASALRLNIIRRRWAIRRAIVRLAEIQVYQAGKRFRGRNYPIYAKEMAKQLKSERLTVNNKAHLAPVFTKLFASQHVNNPCDEPLHSATKRSYVPQRLRRMSAVPMRPAANADAQQAAGLYGMQLRQAMMRRCTVGTAGTDARGQEISQTISGTHADVHHLQADVSKLQASMGMVESEVGSLRGDVRELLAILRPRAPARGSYDA